MVLRKVRVVRRRLPASAGAKPVDPSRFQDPMNIFLGSGCLGDLLAIDAYLTRAERHAARKVLVGVWCSDLLIAAMKLLDFPNVQEFEVLNPTNFVHRWSWAKVETYLDFCKGQNLEPAAGAATALDVGLYSIFPLVLKGARRLVGSSLFQGSAIRPNCPIEGPFTLVAAHSANNYGGVRDFTERDWEIVRQLTQRFDGPFVVCGTDDPRGCPDHPRIINLLGKTTLAEALCLGRACQRYVGVDSMLSVVAAQHLPADKIAIKSVGPALRRYRKIYYPSANVRNIATTLEAAIAARGLR